MGCYASRVDKIVSAFRKNDLDRVIHLCNFNNGRIDHHSITPHEIAKIIHIFNTENEGYDYLISNNLNKLGYETLKVNEIKMDYVFFMIVNVCYKISCLRCIPVMVELLFTEEVDGSYLERFIKNFNNSRFNIGIVHSTIVTYLCYNNRSSMTASQLHTLLVLLKEKCDIHLSVNPSLSIYKYNKNKCIDHGYSVLMMLAQKNYAPLIQLLLDDGADYKQVNKYGLTYYDFLNNDLKRHFKNYNPYGTGSTA
jgi:hypothetical protein